MACGCNKCKENCGCNKCMENPCDECSPKPCKCHPCYNTMIGDCKQPCGSAQPIDSCMTNEYCDDGCDEFLDAKCIQFSDGETLEDKWENLIAILADIKSCITAIGGETIVRGCTDPNSNNYNPNANVDDGSCTYNCPTSGTFNTSISNIFCDTLDLNQFLSGASIGGTWYIGGCGSTVISNTQWQISGSTLFLGNQPALGVHTFNYQVTSANCAPECTEIQLELCNKGNAGTGIDFSFPLNSNQTINLFDYVTGEDQGGVWYDAMGQIVINPMTHIPDTSNVGTWNYSYIVNESCCGGSRVNIVYTVSENNCPDAGTGETLTITEGDSTQYNLFDYLTGETSGGTWTNNGTNTTNLQNFSLLSVGSHTFLYTVSGENCPTDTATVTVIVEEAQTNSCEGFSAGTGSTGQVCVDGDATTINLLDLITGFTIGGVFGDVPIGSVTPCKTFTNPAQVLGGNIDNWQGTNIVLDFAGEPTGIYQFSYGNECDCTIITVEAISCVEPECQFTINNISIVEEDTGNPLTCCNGEFYVDLDATGADTYTVQVDLQQERSIDADGIYGPFACGVETVQMTITGSSDGCTTTSQTQTITLPNDCLFGQPTFCITYSQITNPITGVVSDLYTYAVTMESGFQQGLFNGENIVSVTIDVEDNIGNTVTNFNPPLGGTDSTWITWQSNIDDFGCVKNYTVVTDQATYTIPDFCDSDLNITTPTTQDQICEELDLEITRAPS